MGDGGTKVQWQLQASQLTTTILSSLSSILNHSSSKQTCDNVIDEKKLQDTTSTSCPELNLSHKYFKHFESPGFKISFSLYCVTDWS